MLERLPRSLLRLEGLAVVAGALVLYFHEGFGWVLLAALALAPDLSLAAYAGGARLAAPAYDLAHTDVFPIALGVAGVLAGAGLAVQLALIWLAHIGIDRLVGYGLKYPSSFKETHIQRV